MHFTTRWILTLALTILLCYFLENACGADAPCPEVATTAAMTLRSDLFCSYDPHSRPVKDRSAVTNVTVYLGFESLDFEGVILDIHGQFVFTWRDEFLQWNISDYEDRKDLSVPSGDIWVPDIELFSTADFGSSVPQLQNINCNVNYTGYVMCTTMGITNARCSPDLTRWPFDQHNCSLRMGSWTYNGNEINITLDVEENGTEYYYSPHRDWNLISSGGERRVIYIGNKTTMYHEITYNFLVKRHSRGYVATVIVPALVLVQMTLMIFFLDPGSAERLGLIGVIIVCHCVFLQYLGKHMPRNGIHVPLIVLFFRDSFLMVGVSLLISLVVRRMQAASSSPPAWAVALATRALDTLPGQIFLFSIGDDPKARIRAEVGDPLEASNGWRLLAGVVDRITFIIFFLTFFVLLISMYA